MLVDLSEIIPTTNTRDFLVFYLIFSNKFRLGEKVEIFGDIYKYKKSIFQIIQRVDEMMEKNQKIL